MDLLIKKSEYFIGKVFLKGFIVFILSIGSSDLSGALNYKPPFYLNSSSHNKIFRKEGFIKGRLTQFITKAPVCFADIFAAIKHHLQSQIPGENLFLVHLSSRLLLKSENSVLKMRLFIVNNPE